MGLKALSFLTAGESHGPGLTAIETEPKFGIGQRAHLIQTPAGNVLWDCIAYLDDATVEQINALGGLAAIAISHPHYYSAMVEWAHRFANQNGVPSYDAAVVGYPERMREYNRRRKNAL